MIITNGQSNCVQFYVGDNNVMPNLIIFSTGGFHGNRSWTSCRLSMLHSTNAAQVLHKIVGCNMAYP